MASSTAPASSPDSTPSSAGALACLWFLTREGTMLRATRGYEVERHVGGPADILMRKGPAGPCIALAHHTLANKIDPAHDEEGQDDADDRPDGAAVGWGVI